MNDRKMPSYSAHKKIRLPDGTWVVDMGETGRSQVRDRGRARRSPDSEPPRERAAAHPDTQQPQSRSRRPLVLTEEERRREEARRRAAYEARKRAAEKNRAHAQEEEKKLYRLVFDRIYMSWMSISIDVADIIRGAIIALLMLVFAMLQTTVFAEFRLFGAVPDLMLPFVIAIGVGEGEKWGGIIGLISAVLVECLGGTGLALLALLYVPAGYISGILSTYYFRDSALVRMIFTASACIMKAAFTVILTLTAYEKVSAGLLFSGIIIPEYFSTLILSVIPHIAVYLLMKPFHKSRAERVN